MSRKGKKRRHKAQKDITRSENGVLILRGNFVTTARQLELAYQDSTFYYQFHGLGRTSRVMLCDNPGELEWLQGKVSRGARIIVRPHPDGVKKESKQREV